VRLGPASKSAWTEKLGDGKRLREGIRARARHEPYPYRKAGCGMNERTKYLRWETDQEDPGAHTELSVRFGERTCVIRIEDIPGSVVTEVIIPTGRLAVFVKELAEAF
jgi:hypothetical protein